jgi:hypothetical protein
MIGRRSLLQTLGALAATPVLARVRPVLPIADTPVLASELPVVAEMPELIFMDDGCKAMDRWLCAQARAFNETLDLWMRESIDNAR